MDFVGTIPRNQRRATALALLDTLEALTIKLAFNTGEGFLQEITVAVCNQLYIVAAGDHTADVPVLQQALFTHFLYLEGGVFEYYCGHGVFPLHP